MKKQFFVLLSVGLSLAALAESEDGFNTSWSDGWRLTVGPQFNFNSKGRLGVKREAIPVPASSSSGMRTGASAVGNSIVIDTGSRTTFPNGAFIDPNDAAGVAGETWNWYVPAGQLNDGRMTLSDPYAEQSSVYTVVGGLDRDEANTVGANFGLDRTIWKCGDFGVDAGFNFAFFLKDNWFKGQTGGCVRMDTYTEGSYNTDVNLGNADVLADPWTQNPDGSYGAGSYDGPGPVISLDDVSVSYSRGQERTQTSTSFRGLFSIRGDLQMYEFQFALKPYYEITEWFMLRGTVGLGVDYRNIDVGIAGLGRDLERDWDCYMICGLGGMFHWNDVCLGADFLRKVWDDEMDVNTQYVNGTIANASWMLRIYVGYEF